MGVEIPVVEGGFGEGQKVLLAKTIAEIHGTELRTINQTIDRNIEEFEFGVDLLDLKNSITNCDSLSEGGIYTKQQIANSKNIYLLSEQGYMLLVGFMRTEKVKYLCTNNTVVLQNKTEHWFLAKDVANWIEYDVNKVGQLLRNVDEDEKAVSPIYYSGQGREMWFLTEDGAIR